MTTSRIIRERIQIEETNILLKTDLKKHYLPNFILEQRMELTAYIRVHPEFLTSLEPLVVETMPPTPLIVSMMARAGRRAEVGPMAAVAGTIAQLSMGFMLKNGAKYVIADNGGDVALKTNKDVTVGLYAGESSLSGKIGFKIKHEKTPMGICTSSGTVGHSISFGRADSVTIFADEASIADALATSIANSAVGDSDNIAVHNCLERADNFKEHIRGTMVVVGESAGTMGKIPKLVQTDKKVVLGDFFDVY
ncbi:UPF0280 family protein [Methanobacterium paludis]|uniref:UPF0280 protein MSWAN_0288 n=1 Tax=Methanobacterium paludis (strain DSM 25820 / JCM 18151 / SWAN1) TaxID=868131 RepID=F6D2H5_METPW|nr:UPF0280 family protein [Methanobacterium paludis]AEG17332.1 UPF0280 protein [Methanobacterium paludis]